MKKRKIRRASEHTRKCLAAIDQYIADTGNSAPDLMEVAAWAYRSHILEPIERSPIRALANDLRKACARDYLTNDKGEPVRHRLAYRENRGDKQFCFWFKMEDATPERIRLNAAWRRNGSLMDILQLHRDLDYFNKHHNPGDPIQMDFNFNPDVEEHDLPPDYDAGDGPNQPV